MTERLIRQEVPSSRSALSAHSSLSIRRKDLKPPLSLFNFALSLILTLLFLLISSIPAQAKEECENWLIKAASMQGTVEVLPPGGIAWIPVEINDTFCEGVTIRTGHLSRAAFVMKDETVIRMDRDTHLFLRVLTPEPEERNILLRMIKGAINLFSNDPYKLTIETPFVNAVHEGTEFFVKVDEDRTILSVFEGSVSAENPSGSLKVRKGETVVALKGEAPKLSVPVKPEDAVQWALYYVPVLDLRKEEFPGSEEWEGMVRASIESIERGDLMGALKAMERTPRGVSDPRFFTFRANLFLMVGEVPGAEEDLRRALALDPENSLALSLESIIALTRNDKEKALSLANRAVSSSPDSAPARVALSYAQQAHFDIDGALLSLKEAVRLAPESALSWARLSELYLSTKRIKESFEAAAKAVELNPNLSRTQTVLGFAYLMEIKTKKAREAFTRAILLDQADPMPRLGLGLSLIRDGDLKEGRREIEIAVSLDPANSLLRSYLGKAYFEEKRTEDAREQFNLAKDLDPKDPTPWLYEGIQLQTINRPVEALENLQKSIALNDNRAVYRSRLLLDEDLAVRSVSLARIYDDLGFQWMALNEGWKSVNIDPSNYSAHRFLSDSYFSLPRHDIARVSELLQSQLLQPINIMPIQPQSAESRTFISTNAGPRDPSYNEYTPLFNRDKLSLLVDGAAGENGTFTEDVVQSGVLGRWSYSLGQYHFETDGFRENNFDDKNVYDAFTQVSLTPQTSFQFEYRRTDENMGDPRVLLDPLSFSREHREDEETDTFRLGFRQSFGPRSDLIGSFMYKTDDFGFYERPGPIDTIEFDDLIDSTGYGMEVQHLYRSNRFNIVSGMGHFDTTRDEDFKVFGEVYPSTTNTPHDNIYSYSHINFPKKMIWTVGVSADDFEGGSLNLDIQQVNPKVGLTWNLFDATTLRAALFRTLKRTLLTNQTLEPTQVAGFNQFFDDGEGTDAWRYGVGLDQKLTDQLFAGVEFSWRDLSIPAIQTTPPFPVIEKDADESLGRVYLYWAPHPWFAVGPEYQYERFEYPLDFPFWNISSLDTHRIALGMSFYHPTGLLARLRPTFVVQEGDFWNHKNVMTHEDNSFFVLDAVVGYRLPKRYGLIEVAAKNLFDESFSFQDTDPRNPQMTPDRVILGKWTFSF